MANVNKAISYNEPTVKVELTLSALTALIKSQGGPEGISFEVLLTRIVGANAPHLLAFMLEQVLVPNKPTIAFNTQVTLFDRNYTFVEFDPYSMNPYIFNSEEGYEQHLSQERLDAALEENRQARMTVRQREETLFGS